jgi:hypothetical protein
VLPHGYYIQSFGCASVRKQVRIYTKIREKTNGGPDRIRTGDLLHVKLSVYTQRFL